MSAFRRATVRSVKQWGEGALEASLQFDDGSSGPALVLPDLVGGVDPGDEVIANTTAVDLGLGTGGYHFVLWNLSRDSFERETSGHIMKLRYTPLQFNVTAVEEEVSPHHGEFEAGPDALGGMAVVAGSLHSQLLPVAVAFKRARPGGRLVYIMTDGGSLPIAFSHTVGFLKGEGLIDSTITCGHAFGGDYESVNVYGALLAAKRVCRADAAVVIMGPGVVGTGTVAGFSGMEQASAINAAKSLGGTPIAIARITFADKRERHRGLSNHTVTSLRLGALARAIVPLPLMDEEKTAMVHEQVRDGGIDAMHEIRTVDARELPGLITRCGYSPTVMGRTVSEETEYFMAAGAAGILAAETGGD